MINLYTSPSPNPGNGFASSSSSAALGGADLASLPSAPVPGMGWLVAACLLKCARLTVSYWRMSNRLKTRPERTRVGGPENKRPLMLKKKKKAAAFLLEATSSTGGGRFYALFFCICRKTFWVMDEVKSASELLYWLINAGISVADRRRRKTIEVKGQTKGLMLEEINICYNYIPQKSVNWKFTTM